MAALSTLIGGLAGVLVTMHGTATPRGVAVAAREVRAIAVGGALVLLAMAWISRPLGALAQDTAVFGLAYLAVAVGMAMRFGAIPFHLWAARVAEAAPEVALPLLIAWGPAALAVVGLAWVDGSIAPVAPVTGQLPIEHLVILAIGVACIVLGAIAAWVQEDLEHVVGYATVQDAGVVILAFAVLDPALGPEPDLDPRPAGGPDGLRGLGGRGPGPLRDAPDQRAPRLGIPVAPPRRGPGRDRRGQRRLAGLPRLRRTGAGHHPRPRRSAAGHRAARGLPADPLLRPAAGDRLLARDAGDRGRPRRSAADAGDGAGSAGAATSGAESRSDAAGRLLALNRGPLVASLVIVLAASAITVASGGLGFVGVTDAAVEPAPVVNGGNDLPDTGPGPSGSPEPSDLGGPSAEPGASDALPSPSPSASPSPRPSSSPSRSPGASRSPSPSPKPSATPKPSPKPTTKPSASP